MNISENLQRIQTDKQNIANAINEKGVSCSVSESLDTYADKIEKIQTNIYRYRNGSVEFIESWSQSSTSKLTMSSAGTFSGTMSVTSTLGSAWLEIVLKPYCFPFSIVINSSYAFANSYIHSLIGFTDHWDNMIDTGLPQTTSSANQFFSVGRLPSAYNSTINSFWSYSSTKQLKLRLNFRGGSSTSTSVTINNLGFYTLGYIA